jgi:UDP-glucuronate decarboxylase
MPRLFDNRVLVTGGAGFIGSHLCTQLVNRGFDVLCVDNFLTGSKRNIAHLQRHPRFELIRHDVAEPLAIECDMIFNLACPASPVHYQADPVRTTCTSVLGALNLLQLARRLQVPILQASASEVYGDPEEHPQREEHWGRVNPIGPRACYGEGKRCAESLFADFRRQHGVDTRIARIFNTYGPRMQPHDGRVVSTFIVQALAGEPLTVQGDGLQTRSFCYVDDTVEALLRMMLAAGPLPGPLNVGNPQELRVIDIAEQVLALTGSASVPQRVPAAAEDPRQRCPDISRTSDLLGWRPQVSLADGLTRTIGYFQRLKPAALAE